MKKTIRILSLLLCFILGGGLINISRASDKPKPDMSGNWERDPAKTRIGQMTRSDLENAKVTLTISYIEPELKITVKSSENGKEESWDTVYYTDGRGETNTSRFTQVAPVERNPSDPKSVLKNETKSKTKWEGSKIVSIASSNILHGQNFYMDSREIRGLSKDGKTLTIAYVISGPGGLKMFKEVFNRIP